MACIELPKDAEGREIPLDVEMLYDEYGENYSWDLGRALGLCFVRKGAEKDRVNEFRSLLG